MKNSTKILRLCVAGMLIACSSSCRKDNYDNVTVPETPLLTSTGNVNPADSMGVLKILTASSFPNMGMAVTYGPMSSNAAFLATVKAHANNITFGNELKEGSVVTNNGTYNYTTADALYNICKNNGLQVFGHTLVWHSQQNSTYLNALIAPQVTAPVLTNVLANGGFEAGSGSSFTNWGAYNGAASFMAGSGANEVRTGSRSLKVSVAANGEAYSVQLASDLFGTTVGTSYTMTFYIKAATAGGKMRISTGTTAQYSSDYATTTSFAPYTFTFNAKDAQTRVLIDIGSVANTYYVDDVAVTGPASGSGIIEQTAAQKATAIDNEMKKYITTTMQRYTGNIKAWDVVNEPFTNNGALRTNTNYSVAANNEFLYGQYIGTKYDQNNYILKAFQYAKAADPSALRFINDYNLEVSRAKTDSIVALVNYINKQGALIDGIGTQMHIALNTSHAGIDYAFKALASTGVKIRISELDIILNSSRSATYTPSVTGLNLQADLYKYVMQSYLKNVPVGQRYGVTVWGVSDTDSWLNTTASPDVPLLFDKNYKKKVAFAGFIQGLK
ncbi:MULTISPECIES: endo-1,4-beta-xylanase [unclassified Mucilaginibacter]|uniref:endo-1,4-beta-xylanase n=1 Tax=unclassified Mucilaginibacter TaxID=2617802 RepID=UPI002AC8DF1E|nr:MULTISPECIES: endo-1,4-beta-xylanase [unclassified Mucilaginibacter]MEB0260357.1 endo-1,4-beta-xylanase [Mucilaginibacter sp. 10I4]MEB0279396.1 endo-1,4-beta-xylanase [Mucilaginibacter sp. 10B2]MEB0300524.1 endo-1,4-beta-xylanase [Mucilaginibacter sp. 5C4]WPX21770.1 endo-1,4-beta-xylanase [Mucilaginibacter sp. 5C4]